MGPFPFRPLLKNGVPIQEITEAFNAADASIAVSPSLAQRIASFGYPEPHTIPNVIDERRFVPAQPVSHKFVFFTLCGISDQKGIDHLLEAIALWNPPAEAVEFRIGGDGVMRKAYEKLAVSLGVANRVNWLGAISREAAPRLFQECHAYVMPSRHETFGVVYAEAIACGKPIIATRCGGPESIVNDTNGKLVDIGDVEALSVAMQQVMTHWNDYEPQAIRQDFDNRFSRPAVVKQLASIYKTIVGKSPCVAL